MRASPCACVCACVFQWPSYRFSPYKRAVSMRAPELFRSGKNGKNICKYVEDSAQQCRAHGWVPESADGAESIPVLCACRPSRDLCVTAPSPAVSNLLAYLLTPHGVPPQDGGSGPVVL